MRRRLEPRPCFGWRCVLYRGLDDAESGKNSVVKLICLRDFLGSLDDFGVYLFSHCHFDSCFPSSADYFRRDCRSLAVEIRVRSAFVTLRLEWPRSSSKVTINQLAKLRNLLGRSRLR
jgi:hypothetical protein